MIVCFVVFMVVWLPCLGVAAGLGFLSSALLETIWWLAWCRCFGLMFVRWLLDALSAGCSVMCLGG